jgi:phospholipid-binding lipoprotein MlaA
MSLRFWLAVSISTTALGTQCVYAEGEADYNPDPWESVNRVTYGFNTGVDRLILRPLAKGYHYVTPDFVEQRVHNVFSNVGDVTSFVNNVFQLKGDAAANDFARVVLNTTIGVGGMFDVATPMGSPKIGEDFGQTLGYWGVSSGPYLVLPLFGPSTVRDGFGRIPDSYTNVWAQGVDHIPTRNVGLGLNVLDQRVQLFKLEQLITGDEYIFVRDAYLQQRDFAVKDGRMDAEFNPNDF